jgi:spore coat assembly protein
MRVGDFVVRKSYGYDVVFRIEAWIRERTERVLLRGTDYRLMADAPVEDLREASLNEPSPHRQAMERHVNRTLQAVERERAAVARAMTTQRDNKRKRVYPTYFEVPGKVLHLDGDPSYLRKSMDIYSRLQVPANGYYVPEDRMASALERLLPILHPDIVVLTGHDGLLKGSIKMDLQNLSSYKNSTHFVNAVSVARQYERDLDRLIIVAGACQSHYEALMHAGSNFASSPARVLIHALDPMYVASKVAYTSIRQTVQMTDIAPYTSSGMEGVGGIETRGCNRLGVPRPTIPVAKK